MEANQQYHSDPVAYALRLAEIADEFCEVVHQNDPAGYRAWRRGSVTKGRNVILLVVMLKEK